MRRFAVYIQTLNSVVDPSKNTTSETPVGVLQSTQQPFSVKEFIPLAKLARETFGILPNQKPLFKPLPAVVYIIIDNEKTLCGRDLSYSHYSNYSQFANCKNCKKIEQKNEKDRIPTNS